MKDNDKNKESNININKKIFYIFSLCILLILIIIFFKKILKKSENNKNIENKTKEFKQESFKNKEAEIFYKTGLSEFKIENEDTYVLITDSRWVTLLNDGGSYQDIFYEIDLNKLNIRKISVYHNKKIGETPTVNRSVVYQKQINQNFKNKIESIFNDIINNEDKRDDKTNYLFYTLKYYGNSKNIYNTEMIIKLKELFKEIDNLNL